jgi:hypothetical protein
MAIANCVMALGIVLGFLTYPSQGLAQQPAEMPKTRLAQSAMRPVSATTSKAVLAARFQEIKSRYVMIKTMIVRFVLIK